MIHKSLTNDVVEILKNLPNVITSVNSAVQSITIVYEVDSEGRTSPKVDIKFYDKV